MATRKKETAICPRCGGDLEAADRFTGHGKPTVKVWLHTNGHGDCVRVLNEKMTGEATP